MTELELSSLRIQLMHFAQRYSNSLEELIHNTERLIESFFLNLNSEHEGE